MAARSERDRAVRRVLWIVLGLNVVVAATKFLLSYLTGAVSLWADGIHAALDASSNVVGLIGLGIAARPPDEDHPYGHRRFEALAASIIGLLIAAGLVEIAHQLYDAVAADRAPPRVSWSSAAWLAATVVINFFVSSYENRRGKQLHSNVLTADASHTLADGLAASVVLLSFAGVGLGVPFADLVAAGIVCLFIARTAWRVLTQNVGALTDHAQISPELVRDIAIRVPGVLGVHRIRSRGVLSHVHVDFHVHLDPAMPLMEAHALAHRVADAVRVGLPQVHDVVIHMEPADGRELDPSRLAPGRESRACEIRRA